MKQVPKYILKLLERRRKLAWELNAVGVKIDCYCEKIGVDLGDETASLMSDVKIYCEPDNAYHLTLDAIENAMKEGAN